MSMTEYRILSKIHQANFVINKYDQILGISRNAQVNQEFHEMPGIFRHFEKFKSLPVTTMSLSLVE